VASTGRQASLAGKRAALLLALIVAVALVALGVTSAGAAGPFNVTKTADTNDGTCDDDCSLREAITAANAAVDGGTVNVPAGNYLLTVDTTNTQDDANAEGDLDITGSVTIAGAGPGLTVIDGNGPVLHDHVMQVLSPAVGSISGVTVTNGQSTDEGGGRDDGGGIHVASGTLTLSNAVLTNNDASTPDGYAGGLDVDGQASVSNVTISDNTALGGGGGVEVEGSADFTNVTISGNSAEEDGGGLAAFNLVLPGLTLNNVTIAGNTADSDDDDTGNGGGLYTDSSPVTVANTIIAGNTDATSSPGTISPDCDDDGTVTSMGYNLLQNTAGGCDFTATGDKTGVDPLLGPLAGSPLPTRALASGSPAVDAGNPAAPGSGFPACAATDERGVPRPQRSACDIGAFELEGPAPAGPSPAPGAPSPPKCFGRPATVVGTGVADNLRGTNAADVIAGLGGNDKISGLGGHDLICAGGGKDRAAGGGGNDKIKGGKGTDELRGNAGDDLLAGGKGSDKLSGGGGRDRLNGGPGKDTQRQ
jgi:CSLREA domain-containing protein